MRAQAGRWRALADRCNVRGALALREAADRLDREADGLDGGTAAGEPAERGRAHGE